MTVEGRILIWQRNRSGLRTVPCGTPESTDVVSEDMPSSTTLIDLKVVTVSALGFINF